MNERPPRAPRSEPREIAELKQLKIDQPELSSAIDMQIELVDMQRRIQSRVPLPWIQPEQEWLAAQQQSGRPVVRFDDIPLDWTDFRLALRQTAAILHRFEAIDREEHQHIELLARDGNLLPPLVASWYAASSGVDGAKGARPIEEAAPNLDQVLVLAIRPFLARCAEVLSQRIDLSAWHHGHCPFCGWEPDFAVITPSAERRLICGRCSAQWNFPALACPFCTNADRARITSFATRDGRYRVSACDVCKRYLKAFDGRNVTRPVMVAMDGIATLPLDAAAMQRGYIAG